MHTTKSAGKYQSVEAGSTYSARNASATELQMGDSSLWSPTKKISKRAGSFTARSIKAIKKPWLPPFLMMAGTWLLGTLAAVGHHFFNAAKDGRVTSNQTITLQVGVAFAFIVKALFGISISLSIIQVVWLTVSGKDFTFKALDHLFSVSASASGLLSREVLLKAKLVSFASVCLLLLPLSAITPPSSLTVVARSYADSTPSSCRVPTLNFWDDGSGIRISKDRPGDPYVDNGRGHTELAVTSVAGQTTSFYGGPTAAALRIATASGYGGELITRPSACGPNCTYDISFYAPSLVCDSVDWQSKDAPWYTTDGNKTIYSNATQYKASQSLNDSSIWVTWLYFKEKNRIYDKRSGLPFRGPTIGSILEFHVEEFDFSAVRCQSRNSSYTVRFTNNANGTATAQSVTVLKLNRGAEYNKTIRGLRFEDIRTFPPAHGALEAFSVHDAVFRSLLEGTIFETGGAATRQWGAGGGVVNTDLVEPWLYAGSYAVQRNYTVYYPIKDMGPAIEQLHQNVTLSLLSRSDFFVYDIDKTAKCFRFGSRNVYFYSPRSLWISYGIGVLGSLVVLAVGCMALIRNGEGKDVTFTSVVTTTTDDTLNSVVKERVGDGMQLTAVKLRFLGGAEGFKVSRGIWDGSTEYIRE